MRKVVFKLSFIDRAVWVHNAARALHFSINPVAGKAIAIGARERALTVALICMKRALIAIARCINSDAHTLTLAIDHCAVIAVAVA